MYSVRRFLITVGIDSMFSCEFFSSAIRISNFCNDSLLKEFRCLAFQHIMLLLDSTLFRKCWVTRKLSKLFALHIGMHMGTGFGNRRGTGTIELLELITGLSVNTQNWRTPIGVLCVIQRTHRSLLSMLRRENNIDPTGKEIFSWWSIVKEILFNISMCCALWLRVTYVYYLNLRLIVHSALLICHTS